MRRELERIEIMAELLHLWMERHNLLIVRDRLQVENAEMQAQVELVEMRALVALSSLSQHRGGAKGTLH